MATAFPATLESLERLHADIHALFNGKDAEIFLTQYGGHVVSRTGSVEEMVMPFIDYCRSLPSATIKWNPGHEYGMIARARCDCAPEIECPLSCRIESDHPKAMFIIKHRSVGHREAPEPRP